LKDALDVSWILNGLIDAFVSAKRLSQYSTAQELDRFGYLGRKEHMVKNKTDEEDVTFRQLFREVIKVFRKKKSKKVKTTMYVSLVDQMEQSEESDDDNPQPNIIETEPLVQNQPKLPSPTAKIENGTFCWGLDDEFITLENVNIEFPIGKLSMITGIVGSGKSSLISALLGEMRQISPKGQSCVQLQGDLAYCSQQAWILNATVCVQFFDLIFFQVRDNITFGNAFDEKKYQQVLEDCALLPDLKVLKAGDMTEIGEKGINLSGGQKQRVSIARALYANAQLYIFDDPLSALDAHVGHHVFNNCILKLAKQGKTIILVTHQLQYLPLADFLIEMKDGKIHSAIAQQKLVNFEFSQFQENSKQEIVEEISVEISAPSPLPPKHTVASGKLIEDEERKTGSVALSVYISYLKVCGVLLSSLSVLVIVLSRASSIGADWWMSFWSSSAQNPGNTHSTGYFIGGYAGFGTAVAIIFAADYFLVSAISVRSSKKLHTQLLDTVSRAPMSFFDTTPIGRILNRFSSDVKSIDEVLCDYMFSVIRRWVLLASTLLVQIIATPLFLIPSLPIFILYALVQKFFRATSVELKRMLSISRSPIYAHFSESLGGLATIRSYHSERSFMEKLVKRVSLNLKTNAYIVTSNRWLGVVLQLMGIVLVFFACIFMSISAKTIPVVLVGLSFTYTLKGFHL
jgi:ATP-binding cassette subfamily C (CFTR/MRP) protein 1